MLMARRFSTRENMSHASTPAFVPGYKETRDFFV